MADNVTVPGTGALLAFDECVINGVTVQVARMKQGFGVDGTYVEISATNPLPASLSASDAGVAAINAKLDILHADLNASGPLPAGTNVIGGVTQSGTWSVNTTPTGLSPGSGSLATAAGSATTTSAVLVTARSGRQSVTIVNEGTTAFRVGPSGVTASNGILVPGILGASITLQTAAAVAVVTASGTASVSYVELF